MGMGARGRERSGQGGDALSEVLAVVPLGLLVEKGWSFASSVASLRV